MTNKERDLPFIDLSANLMKRVHEYRLGTADENTKRYNLHRLVFFGQFETMERATAREKQLRNWHRSRKYELIEEANPDWRNLAEDFGFEALW